MNRHEPVRMVYTGRFHKKQGGRCGGRQWNVWYSGFRCSTCGSHTSRPCNPFKGRKVPPPVCDGVTYDEMTGRPVKRPAKMTKETE